MYRIDILIPTARFVFAVHDGVVDVLPEHRSPQAFAGYQELRATQPVVGHTTFPNTVLLRGLRTILVDPGLHIQNEPVVRALEARGLSADDVDAVALTHAHLDHAGACADLELPVTLHERETREPHWAAVQGILQARSLTLLSGDEGDLAEGISWVRVPGHTDGGIIFKVQGPAGLVVLCGDLIGPLRDDFDRLTAPADEPAADQLLAAWKLIRSWRPALVIPGHVPPFAPRATSAV
jgi:glyoxylase-like metal-dependent hydrolase (beta-lactamase superfamily II)